LLGRYSSSGSLDLPSPTRPRLSTRFLECEEQHPASSVAILSLRRRANGHLLEVVRPWWSWNVAGARVREGSPSWRGHERDAWPWSWSGRPRAMVETWIQGGRLRSDRALMVRTIPSQCHLVISASYQSLNLPTTSHQLAHLPLPPSTSSLHGQWRMRRHSWPQKAYTQSQTSTSPTLPS
jgi:hypothetical protein